MTPTQLLQHFDRLSEAPDAIPSLRRFILDLAVRGKLVEQDCNDEPAAVLLKRIEVSRERLMKEGEIKKQETPPVISGDELFQIPNNWVWTRLGKIADWGSGSTPSRGNHEFFGGGITWLKSGELNDNQELAGSDETVSELAVRKCSFRQNQPGDVLIAMYGATIGKVAILAEPAVTNQAVCGCTPFTGVFNRYLFNFLLSQREQFHSASEGGAQPNISKVKVVSFIFPLPPLTEQHRIVARVDELMALCDQLEEAKAEREQSRGRLLAANLHHLNQTADDEEAFREHVRFTFKYLPLITTRPAHIKQLRQTILNLAVRGKLVPQNPNDEPAEALLKCIHQARERLYAEKKIPKPKNLPSLEDLGIPFTIPVGWSWTMLGTLCYQVSDGPHFSPSYVSRDEGMPFLSTRNVRIGGFDLSNMKYVSKSDHEEFCKRIRPEKGDIIYTKGGTTGIARVNDLDFEFSVWVHLAVLRVAKEFLEPRYIELALNSPLCYEQSQAYTQGISNFDLGLTRMIKIVMPLPPRAEQHRIVTKVDELMALCDQLETQITTTETDSRSLLEAVLHDALSSAQKDAA
jgi:type I restriction enzyme, S subunit